MGLEGGEEDEEEDRELVHTDQQELATLVASPRIQTTHDKKMTRVRATTRLGIPSFDS